MPDTVRTWNDLLAVFADGQGDGEITAQDMRDLIVSIAAQNGWGAYQDGDFSVGSPQLIAADTDTTVQIGNPTVQEQELPYGVTSFWDATNDKILTDRAGSGYQVTFEHKIARQSGTASYGTEAWIDIGLPGPVKLYPRTTVIDNGGGYKTQTWSTGAYALDTWQLNGGLIKLRTEVATQIYDSRVIVHQFSRGQGTYPPA